MIVDAVSAPRRSGSRSDTLAREGTPVTRRAPSLTNRARLWSDDRFVAESDEACASHARSLGERPRWAIPCRGEEECVGRPHKQSSFLVAIAVSSDGML